MGAALWVWWRALRHLNRRGYTYVWANVLWFILTLPVFTAPAAWAGLVKMSRRAQTSPHGDLHDFWEGFRENLGRGVVMSLVNLLVIVVNVTNLLAYRYHTDIVTAMMRVVWLTIVFVWFVIQLYLWPLYYEMRQPSLAGALRNAAVMVIVNPLFTVVLWLVMLVFMSLSTVFAAAWFLLMGSLMAIVATAAVLDRLVAAGVRAPLPDPKQAAPELGRDDV